MPGEGDRRFCEACRREVFDLDRLSPDEIRRRLQAGRGRLCGRLTRRVGQLAPRPPEPPLVALPSSRPRTSALAAGLITTLLSAASAPARTVEPAARLALPAADEPVPTRAAASRAAAVPGATLSGTVRDELGGSLPGARVVARDPHHGVDRTVVAGPDGDFVFADLPAGLYEVEAALEGFEAATWGSIELAPGDAHRVELALALDATMTTVTVGALAVVPAPLRQLFDESDLVAGATIGASRVVGEGELLEVLTELTIETVVKGAAPARPVRYRHTELGADDEVESWRAELAPGTPVLVFLRPAEASLSLRGRPVFEAAGETAIKRLGPSERAAFLDRLEELVRIERRAARRGEVEPAEIAEWLVATAEEPLTRAEAMDELLEALTALRERAEETGDTLEAAAEQLRLDLEALRLAGDRLGEELSPELLGAFVVEARRERLDAALAAAAGVTEANLQLSWAVEHWNQEAARSWLLERLRDADPEPPDEEQTWLLLALLEELEGEAGREYVETVFERASEIDELWPRDESAEIDPRRQAALLDLNQQVRERLADRIEASP